MRHYVKTFIVELETGIYLAAIGGDPGRTVKKENAKRYTTRQRAENAILAARQYRPFRNAKVTTQQEIKCQV